MKKFILRWEWLIAFAAIAIAEFLSFELHGWRGFTGMSLGIGATWFNSWAWWGIVGALGDSVRGGAKRVTRSGTIVVVLAFLLKLPILLGLGLLTRKIGGAALPCFVAGLGMVYFGLVGWACTHA